MSTAPLVKQSRPASGSSAWTGAQKVADRYLKSVGVSIPYVRRQLVRAASQRLNKAHRSDDERVLAIRMLACVERVLCDRLGARPGTDTTDPDTAQRRFRFAINPSPNNQMKLLITAAAPDAVYEDDPVIRIPPVRCRVTMTPQDVGFRRPPWM